MIEEVEHRFTVERVDRVPYLWSYPAGSLETSARGYRVTKQLRSTEQALIAEESLAPVGLRVVARRR